ncbi:unnamed protein product [Linum trigynum]|uniref:PORR domain-containing protein n=1 Tax=Linum trigynum TaxID=586398 RepID=A0AAV2GN50_9ROSI
MDKIKTFLRRNPLLFDTFYNRIKPKSEPVLFIRPSQWLMNFLEEEKMIQLDNEEMLVAKLCKLLMMAKDKRADRESRLSGIRVRPNFNYKLPPGFFLMKEMREWVRDWLELEYVSHYVDAPHLEQSSPEMEKRAVGVFP